MERPPRTAAAKERNQPKPRSQAVVVAEGGTGEVTWAFGGVQTLVSRFQTLDINVLEYC